MWVRPFEKKFVIILKIGGEIFLWILFISIYVHARVFDNLQSEKYVF